MPVSPPARPDPKLLKPRAKPELTDVGRFCLFRSRCAWYSVSIVRAARPEPTAPVDRETTLVAVPNTLMPKDWPPRPRAFPNSEGPLTMALYGSYLCGMNGEQEDGHEYVRAHAERPQFRLVARKENHNHHLKNMESAPKKLERSDE